MVIRVRGLIFKENVTSKRKSFQPQSIMNFRNLIVADIRKLVFWICLWNHLTHNFILYFVLAIILSVFAHIHMIVPHWRFGGIEGRWGELADDSGKQSKNSLNKNGRLKARYPGCRTWNLGPGTCPETLYRGYGYCEPGISSYWLMTEWYQMWLPE